MPHPRFHPAPLALAIAVAVSTLGLSAVHAQTAAASPGGATFSIALAVQPLDTALNELARQARLQLMVHPDLVAGKSAPAVSGTLTARQALERLLAGSGLVATMDGSAVVVKAAPAATGITSLPAVTVMARPDRETATSHVDGYIAKRSATATKTDTPIIETPQSISVVTADFAGSTGATRLRDALAYTPGVNISPYGSDSRFDWVVLRGFDAFAPGYFLDGMPMRNALTWSAWLTESYGNERIEVLRGPSSVLYGQNIAGGMVNVVSKRPTVEPLREIRMQLGSHASREFSGDFAGTLDGEGTVSYRLTGLVRDAQLPVSGQPNDRVYIAPSLTWQPTQDTSLTLLSQYLRQRGGTGYQVLPLGGTLRPNPNGAIPLSTYLGEPRNDHYNQEQWMLGYLLEHRVNDTWTLRQNARYGHLQSDYMNTLMFGDFVRVNAANADDPANFRLARRRINLSLENAETFTLDNQVQGRFTLGEWQHTVLFGLDHQRTRYDTVFANGGSAQSIDVYAPVYGGSVMLPVVASRNQDVDFSQTGVYAQDQIRLQDRWVATVGGRLDRAEIDATNRLAGAITRHTDHKFSGRAGLVYLHPNGLAPYVSYAESFNPSTVVDPSTGTLFKAETGKQYEVGIRYQPPGRKDSYSAALFDLRRQNYVTYDLNGNPRQTGEVTARGLELEALVVPFAGVQVTASYTWTPKAEVTASSTASEIGAQLDPYSRHQASLWGDYRFGNGWKLGLGVRHMGANDQYSRPVTVPAYTLLDAMLGYDTGRWSLALNARNLADRAYISNAYVTGSFGRVWVGDGRRVTATATYRW